MTDYDHDKAKVLYPAGAAEVERLRDELDRLEWAMGAMSHQAERFAMDMKGFMLEAVTEDGA